MTFAQAPASDRKGCPFGVLWLIHRPLGTVARARRPALVTAEHNEWSSHVPATRIADITLGQPALKAGFLPIPGRGPSLAWRSVNAQYPAPRINQWKLSLGDVELL